MITYRKYTYTKKDNGLKLFGKYSKLVAKLRFSNEVALKDRGNVEKRIDYFESELPNYLVNQENFVQTKRNNLFRRGSMRIEILSPFWFKLGFNIKITSDEYLLQEQMINLEALNHFCLTGEQNYGEQNSENLSTVSTQTQ